MSADARPRGSAARGRLRIYLGYAPGAGTTSALLSEGRQRAEHGTDIVVASAETHGRPHTGDLLAGLEIIPFTKVPYQGTRAEEMNLAAVLADLLRHPAQLAALRAGATEHLASHGSERIARRYLDALTAALAARRPARQGRREAG